MSKFFRSASSTSSSASSDHEDSSADDDDDGDLTASKAASDAFSQDISSESVNSILRVAGAASAPVRAIDNRDLLVHALLEERCMREVLDEFKGILPNDGDRQSIEERAHARYRHLCNSLLRHNLIASGPDGDDFAITRQRVRDGLDLLSKDSRSAESGWTVTVPHAPRKLLTNAADIDLVSVGLGAVPGGTFGIPATIWPQESHQLYSARYMRDFDEIGLLGKGGFGVVFQVQNRIDGMRYAVKKIPISSARVARIQARGSSEIAELTREVRTLARLDHPNIVRYYAAWVEWTNPMDRQSNSRSTDFSEDSSAWLVNETDDSMIETSLSLRRVITQDNSNQTHVVFESSTSTRTSQREALPSPQSQHYSSADDITGTEMNALSKPGGPILCLHLQMGLYPLTLADFISPRSGGAQSIQPLAHCFHIGPSLDILSAIVAGVEYLHSEEFLHQDLKPANIFMIVQGAASRTVSSTGLVDLAQCQECQTQKAATPARLNIRVGDLGLVTKLARPEACFSGAEETTQRAVGTEIYRPLVTMPEGSAELDVFALGIIMFELLWRFDTRMERHDRIWRLKRGEFPKDFTHALSDRDDAIKTCIMEMLNGKLKMATLGDRLQRLRRFTCDMT